MVRTTSRTTIVALFTHSTSHGTEEAIPTDSMRVFCLEPVRYWRTFFGNTALAGATLYGNLKYHKTTLRNSIPGGEGGQALEANVGTGWSHTNHWPRIDGAWLQKVCRI